MEQIRAYIKQCKRSAEHFRKSAEKTDMEAFRHWCEGRAETFEEVAADLEELFENMLVAE